MPQPVTRLTARSHVPPAKKSATSMESSAGQRLVREAQDAPGERPLSTEEVAPETCEIPDVTHARRPIGFGVRDEIGEQ